MRKRYLLLLMAGLVGGACLGQQPVSKSQRQYRQMGDREGRLKPGDPAADFDLKMLHSDTRIQLSSLKAKKPVALVFGSFT